MNYDVEKVMVTNEQQSALITRQRQELDHQHATIRALKAENESLRNTVGVLRFRLWSRDNGDVVPTDAKVIFQHSWSEGDASFRNIVVKLKNGAEAQSE